MSLITSDKKPTWMLAVFIAAAAFVAYLPALDCGFIWDDHDYVTQNEVLRTAGGIGRIWFDPTSIPQYYPLVHTTFWIEYQLWELSPAGYHATNILLHALASVLLLLVLSKLRTPLPFLAAAIFALHPVHVESVAWITERKNVLSGVFYFLALLAWMRWRPIEGQTTEENGPARFYWLSVAAFCAALLSKTVVCSLPAVLLLLIWWKRGRLARRDVLATLPLFAIGLVMAMVTAMMERDHVLAKGADWDFSFVERCLIAGRALWFYTAKLIWPTELSFNYTRWTIDAATWWQYLFPAGVLAAGTVLWFLRKRLGRGPLTAVLIFAGSLVPALGFVNVYPMIFSFVADHFQYLASVGMIVLFCGAVKISTAALIKRFTPGNGDRATKNKLAAAKNRLPAVGLALLLLLGLLTFRQTGAYEDLETLWLDTLRKNPESWLALGNLGGIRLNQGRFAEARGLIEKAIEEREPNPYAHNNLGLLLLQTGNLNQAGDPDGARVQLETAIRQRPDWAEPYNNLAVFFWRADNLPEAIRHVQKALSLKPEYYDARRNIAELFALTGEREKAQENMAWVLRRNPADVDLRLMMAELLMEKGNFREALDHFKFVFRLRPDCDRARSGINAAGKALQDMRGSRRGG